MKAPVVPASDLRFAKGGEGSLGVYLPYLRPMTEAAVSAQERIMTERVARSEDRDDNMASDIVSLDAP